MWWEFLIGVAACLLALYGPGWLLLRSARMDSVLALASAPLGSLFGYALLGVLFGEPGIACSWVNTWALSGAVFGAARAASRLLAKGRAFPSAPSGERGLLLLYIAAGTAVCLCVFVSGLDDAASYYCRYDNQTHYTLARHFADSGDWSTLHDWTGSLADDHRSGYYPSAWHALAVLVHSLTGLELPLAFNALNATLAGIVFPASMYALMRALFPLRRSVRAAGALASASFACLPWVFLLKGQLLANLTSIAVMPAAIGLVICYAENGGPSPLANAGICLDYGDCRLRLRAPQRAVCLAGVPGALHHSPHRPNAERLSAPLREKPVAKAVGDLGRGRAFRLCGMAVDAVRPSPAERGLLQQHGKPEPHVAREPVRDAGPVPLPGPAHAVAAHGRLHRRLRRAGKAAALLARPPLALDAVRLRRLPMRGRALRSAHVSRRFLVQRPLSHTVLRRAVPRSPWRPWGSRA